MTGYIMMTQSSLHRPIGKGIGFGAIGGFVMYAVMSGVMEAIGMGANCFAVILALITGQPFSNSLVPNITLHMYSGIIEKSSDFKYLCVYINLVSTTLLLSYEEIKHIVEVDEKILAVFTIDSKEKISDIFIAPDAKINKSFIEILTSNLDLKFKKINNGASTAEEDKSRTQIIGKHLWDISEYDKIRVIKVYEANRLIVVLAKSHTLPGDTADTVLGYLYECNDDEQEHQEESPPCLF